MKIKIRHALILFNSGFIILTAAVIILLYSKSTKFSVYSICEKYMNEVLSSVKNSSRTFFGSVEAHNRNIAVHYWEDSLRSSMESGDTSFQYFKQIAESDDGFEMVYFADTRGNMVMARRMPDSTISKRVVRNDGEFIYENFYHVNQEFNNSFPSSVKPADEGYDPRRRAWYKTAVENRRLSWTDVYFFATGNQPGFSCSMPVFRADGSLIGVSCIDVTVGGLSHFLKRFSLTPNARLFILDGYGQIVAEPIAESESLDSLFVTGDGDGGAAVKTLRNIADGDGVLRASYQYFTENPDGALRSFYSGGNKFFSLYDTLTTTAGLTLQFGLVIPDNDVMGIVYRNNLRILLIALCFIAAAIAISIAISRVIAGPMNALSEEMDKIKTFSQSDSSAISSAIDEISGMVSSFVSMKKGLTNFQKYVPSKLVNELIESNQLATVGGQKKELTVFFSDVENFTNISESMEPEELVTQMNDYFSAISNTILENEGTLDKYIGDSVMAFWGAPVENPNHAAAACRSALICQELIFNLCHKWSREGKPVFKTRIGIHTDNVVVGNVGYEKRINYTVLGDGVNLASRLEGINKFYGTQIVISQNTFRQVHEKFHTRMLDRITVKGKSQPVHIFELLAERGKLNKKELSSYKLYEDGLNCYFAQNWDDAIDFFQQVLAEKDDSPSKIMIARCLAFKESPPPSMWNGVHEFTKK